MKDPSPEKDDSTGYPVLPLTPPGGWTLDNLPLTDLPNCTELIRGVLVMSPQTTWHSEAVRALDERLRPLCPPHLSILPGIAIRRSPRTAPEPDIAVFHAEALDFDKIFYRPDEVVLAAEVMTPESEERDREDKPRIYASMGIPAFWLIEQGEQRALVVHEHVLNDGAYRLAKTHVGRLVTDFSFKIDISLEAP
ncbi:MAG TPA: Uma2 family endonuclease [Actinospica sp.]|jgi:Uma2 family endonuclease|nr:Uma2 family endonuclease [Actinospica sp.]